MTRTATISTTVDDPEAIAAALRPDNTAEMRTQVDGDTVRTVIERETTAGLRSTVDDYVVNLSVALAVTRTASEYADTNT